MIISYKNRFVFIHNYKVGGTSIQKALEKHGIVDAPYSKNIVRLNESMPRAVKTISNKILIRSGLIRHFPSHCKAVEVKNVVGEEWDYMYKFGFVRNPWDWQVSLFHYMRQEAKHFQYDLANSFKDFDEYIEWRVKNEVRLQKSFFVDDHDKVIVDYIGRLENLDDELKIISDNVGFEISVGHHNKSKHDRYVDYYNAKTKQMVADAFAEDIEFFGYDFE